MAVMVSCLLWRWSSVSAIRSTRQSRALLASCTKCKRPKRTLFGGNVPSNRGKRALNLGGVSLLRLPTPRDGIGKRRQELGFGLTASCRTKRADVGMVVAAAITTSWKTDGYPSLAGSPDHDAVQSHGPVKDKRDPAKKSIVLKLFAGAIEANTIDSDFSRLHGETPRCQRRGQPNGR